MQRVARVGVVDQRLDALERCVTDRHRLDPEPLARPPPDPAALATAVEEVARDAEQPPDRALAVVAELSGAEDRRGETSPP